MSEVMDREFDWNDVIEKDGSDFIVLPEGDYDFVVAKFERGRHKGSEKLPACNKAILSLSIDAPEGSTTITHNLFLHTKTEGMLSAFFTAIGHKKKGEKLQMNWTQVIGAKGRCRLIVDSWTTDDGKVLQNNKVKKFYEPDVQPVQQTTPQATPQPMQQTIPQTQGGFVPGRF